MRLCTAATVRQRLLARLAADGMDLSRYQGFSLVTLISQLLSVGCRV